MSRAISTAAGLLAAGALVAPFTDATAAPQSLDELQNSLNAIPDPSTAPSPPTAPVAPEPAEAPAAGEPPDADADGEDPFATPVPATPEPTTPDTPAAVATPAQTATPEPTVVTAASPVPTSTPEATPTPAVVASVTPTPEPPAPPIAPPPEAQVRDHPHSTYAKHRRGRTQTRGRVPASNRVTPPVAPQPSPVAAARTRSGRIRVGTRAHVIQPGECLSVIAAHYGLDWRRLAVLNDVSGPDYVIYAGDTLLLPA